VGCSHFYPRKTDLQATPGIVGAVTTPDMTGGVVGPANVTWRVVSPARSTHMAGGIVTGTAPHGRHALIFLATTARRADAIISTTAASMAHPVIGASSPAVSVACR